jgi:serine/threonine protein kinase
MQNDIKNKSGCMNRINKIGEGSYGVVYSATFKEDDKKVYAVKRNFKELSSSWFGNVHEADVLIRLKGHPFIVELHRIALGDPFDLHNAMSPTTADKRKMAEDKMHFILEYVGTCGDSYLTSKQFSYANSRIILTQIALALEYMHSKKIIHRDLKPANILMDFNNSIPYSKVCDFGMSCNYNKYEAKTPGVVTCWYRAPEICFGHKDYDYKSDVWSFGCLLYEFISREPWLMGIQDDDSKIFNTILSKLQTPALEEDIEYLKDTVRSTRRINVVIKDNMKRRLSYESQLNLRPSQKMEFEKFCGPIGDFIDLMDKCLQINPSKRIDITQVIDHQFFKYYKSYIQSVRSVFNNPPQKIQVVINNSIERKWVVELALNIYNNRKNNDYKKWYNHIIIFHAINIFERYMDWALKEGNDRIELLSEENMNHGRLYNKSETELRFWVCLYIMHKYYSTLVHPKKWDSFCPKQYIGDSKSNSDAEDFEYRLLRYACNYNVFQETLYEMSDKYEILSEENIHKILSFYSGIDNYIGTLDGLYNRYRDTIGLNPIN